jgi:hypothetical protein
MINPDSGGYRLLSIARLLEISLQRAQHLVRANYIFFWQLYLRLLAAQKI